MDIVISQNLICSRHDVAGKYAYFVLNNNHSLTLLCTRAVTFSKQEALLYTPSSVRVMKLIRHLQQIEASFMGREPKPTDSITLLRFDVPLVGATSKEFSVFKEYFSISEQVIRYNLV